MTRGRGQPPHDLTGQRFGRLVVVGRAPTVRYSRWRCRCDCGGEVVVPLNLLRMGANGTRSCGCPHHDLCKRIRAAIDAARGKP